MTIEIDDEFKKCIKHFVDISDSKRSEYILKMLIEQGYIDDEFGHIIYEFDEDSTGNYNLSADLAVQDAIEVEIKHQLLNKYNN